MSSFSPKNRTKSSIDQKQQKNFNKNLSSNGGNFHSISLRSPANQPIVLSFEGNYNDNNENVSTKLNVDEARKNSEETKIKDAVRNLIFKDNRVSYLKFFPQIYKNSIKSNKSSSTWLSNFCQRPLASRRFLLFLVLLLSILAILLIISLIFVLLSVRWPNGEEKDDVDFLNKYSSWQYSCEHKCNAK